MQDGMRDPQELITGLSGWLREQVDDAGAGVLVGLSGGIDSAVLCGLAARALGPERCLAVIMPIGNPDEDAELAREVSDTFQVRTIEVPLDRPFAALHDALVEAGHAIAALADRNEEDPLAVGNLKPRLRMVALYYYANLLDYLVLGTGNRAELAVGYFTKHGDGGADLLPLGTLVKGEVRAVARELGVPRRVIERPPSAGLWEGQTDEQELGLGYDDLDRFLLEGSSGSEEIDWRIRRMMEATRHKRSLPPVGDPVRAPVG